jgi:hypothetical protein
MYRVSFYCFLYIAVVDDHDLSLHSLFPVIHATAFTPSILRLAIFEFVFASMCDGGRNSPMTEEVGAPNMMEVPHPEEPVMSSSSRGSSSSGSESDNAAQEEGSEAVDPRESSQSYVFGPSIIMVDRVRKMASLGYFAEGTAREPGEEVVLEPIEDEAIVFKDFFWSRDLHAPSTGPCLYSTQVLGEAPPTDPNAIAQLSKFYCKVPPHIYP